MRWECSECGDVTSAVRPPDVCGRCGLAVGVFMLADEVDDEGPWTRFADPGHAELARGSLGPEHA